MSREVDMPGWGLLPKQAKDIVRQREWDNVTNLKARLSGKKPFPIRIGLKPPSGRMAMESLAHFQNFIRQWQSFSAPRLVRWETRRFRDLSEQIVPVQLVLESVQDLIGFLGEQAAKRSQIWSQRMLPLLEIGDVAYPVLVKHLLELERMTAADAALLADLIPQLTPGMGSGKYLRALLLVGVDTKFLEKHPVFIGDLVDVLHNGDVSAAGGLSAWLGCLSNPKGWLTVRPLCQSALNRLGGVPIMQISSNMLKRHPLPAHNILIVENIQPGLGLPELEDTIAVFGGGKNVAWMGAEWLQAKRVAYWGDIDTWGLSILSDVRALVGHVEPLMMDADTVKCHEGRMVDEPRPVNDLPEFLTSAEAQLFNDLKSEVFKASRLEQERLSADYIYKALGRWVNNISVK